MKKNPPGPFSRKTVWQRIGLLVILGVAVHLILPQITTLENSWQVLTKMSLWAVGLAFTSQVASYLGSGFLLQKILAIVRQAVSLVRSTLIVLASASIGMVAGGTVGSSAAIYRWTSAEKRSVEGATLASILPPLFNDLLLVFLSIFGLVHLILVHNLTRVQLIGFSAALTFLGLLIGLSLLIMRYRQRATAAIVKINGWIARLRHKPFDPATAGKQIDRMFHAWDAIWQGEWHILLLGAFLNVAFDMLTLYFLFVAAGNTISFGVLLSGYGLPLLLGKMAFILPGGVGVVESSMAALYNELGIPHPTTVVVVLGYRLLSFWIPSLLGFPIAALLERSRTKARPHRSH